MRKDGIKRGLYKPRLSMVQGFLFRAELWKVWVGAKEKNQPGDQLSWVLGSWMQLKPEGLPVLRGNTAPVAFLTDRDDLVTGQAGCCPGLM